mmetsp:Transcript_39453/g.82777  ORF Transcript_39453/g.82777 Transcript_39453/m.82777 type:complete len:113 (-) Transcript_39453:1434-1772(-)
MLASKSADQILRCSACYVCEVQSSKCLATGCFDNRARVSVEEALPLAAPVGPPRFERQIEQIALLDSARVHHANRVELSLELTNRHESQLSLALARELARGDFGRVARSQAF